MDRFRELETFAAVAEEGAFSAAARRLGSSPPAVTRLVSALEARLGVRLLTRTTRQVALTEAGARLLAGATRILAELEAAEASAAGAQLAPQGRLRVTAPVLFGRRYIAPVLNDYLDAWPAMTAEALYLDRVVDLIGEGLDLAVRIGELPDSSLTALRVGAVRRMIVAAPAYLAARGTPRDPDDLRDHRIVHFRGSGGPPLWEFSAARRRRHVRVEPALTVNTNDGAIDAAIAGFGIARVLSYQIADALTAGTLVEILGAHEDRDMPIHLIHAGGTRPAAKVRAFLDLAAARLRAEAGHLAAR